MILEMVTPDGFSDIGIDGGVGCGTFYNTENFAGWASAYDGNKYCGILAYYNQGGQINGREYLQVLLSEVLEVNKTYKIGFRAKFGSKSSYAVSHLGLYVSENPIGPPDTSNLIDIEPHIDFNDTFSDTSYWEIIEGYYTAQGNESYITIGNFYSDEESSVISNPNQSIIDPSCLLSYYGAYYYIDGVFVEETTVLSTTSTRENIKLYPNPAEDYLYIENSLNWHFEYHIFNALGEEMFRGKCKSNNHKISLDELSSGIYFLRLSITNSIYKIVVI